MPGGAARLAFEKRPIATALGMRTGDVLATKRSAVKFVERVCAVSIPRTIIIEIGITSEIVCSVFGRMPLCSGKKECVVAYIT